MKFSRYFALFYRPYVLLLFYIFLSTMLMNFSDPSSLRGIRWAVLQTIELVDTVKMNFAIRNDLEKENDQLKNEVFSLHIANQKLREMALENSRLKKMIELKEQNRQKFVPARVIADGSDMGIKSVILNVGERDSVFKNMAVVNAEGLVGKIILATANQSIVQILNDHDCRVGGRLEHSREAGIVGWSEDPWLDLNYIPKNIPVVRGELVVTSGLSKIYPPGLKIGVVADFSQDEHDLFKTVKIKPAVNFNAVEEVFVIRTPTPENITLE